VIEVSDGHTELVKVPWADKQSNARGFQSFRNYRTRILFIC
jgi:hypothetical protein